MCCVAVDTWLIPDCKTLSEGGINTLTRSKTKQYHHLLSIRKESPCSSLWQRSLLMSPQCEGARGGQDLCWSNEGSGYQGVVVDTSLKWHWDFRNSDVGPEAWVAIFVFKEGPWGYVLTTRATRSHSLFGNAKKRRTNSVDSSQWPKASL